MLLPFQGANTRGTAIPRALPWAMSLLGFQPATCNAKTRGANMHSYFLRENIHCPLARGNMLLPFQGANSRGTEIPRALPWAMSYLGFQPATCNAKTRRLDEGCRLTQAIPSVTAAPRRSGESRRRSGCSRLPNRGGWQAQGRCCPKRSRPPMPKHRAGREAPGKDG